MSIYIALVNVYKLKEYSLVFRYVRRDVEILGKFTLNLCNVPSGILPKFTSSIYEIIETLVPCSHYLPMELSILNNTKFIPK